MKVIKRVGLLSALLIVCCSENITKSEEPEPLFFSSETICDCHKSAVGIHLSLIKEETQEPKDMFQQLREECLMKYGSFLFIPSDCNDPDYLQTLSDSLITLGINING